MTRISRKIVRGVSTGLLVMLATVLFGGLLAGCEGLQPYRTVDPDHNQVCDPDEHYNVEEKCWANLHEHSTHYDLFFTEFTDQGLQFPSEEYSEAGYQINPAVPNFRYGPK
jgi:hypothetical protein